VLLAITLAEYVMCVIIKQTPKVVLTHLLLFFAVLGCTFEPQEEFFNEVKQVTPSAIVDLTDYNEEDTIVMLQPTKFKYMAAISKPSALQELQILVDSDMIVSTPAISGEFTLSQSLYPSGYTS